MELLDIKEESVIVQLSREDIHAISGALNEALENLDDWEFEIRMGFTINEIKSLLAEFRSIHQKLPPDG